MAVIDEIMKVAPDPELKGAMEEPGYMFVVKVRAIEAVRADRTRPKYERLGMERLAWFFRIDERTLYEWWAAYKEGGIDALRSNTMNRGRKAMVPVKTLEEARDALLARNSQAEAARNL